MLKRSVQAFALTFIASFVTASTYAIGPGLYLGVAFGPATNNGSTQQAQILNTPYLTPVKPKSKQFATRAVLGYQMNTMAAWELGFDFFTSIHYSQQYPNIQLCSGPSVRIRDIDLLGKLSAPFYYFDVFGKAGVAAVYTTVSGSLNPTYEPSKHITCGSSKYTLKYDPMFAVGASWNITQGWVTDLTLQTILTGQQVKSVSSIMLGLSYHFTDKFCGQFLC